MTAETQAALDLETSNTHSGSPVEFLHGNETAGGEHSRRNSLVQSAPVANNIETSQAWPVVTRTTGSTYPIRPALEPHCRHYFERSLEDLVRELLHPLLKQWLDQNLPGIVERLVNEEIERMVERSNH